VVHFDVENQNAVINKTDKAKVAEIIKNFQNIKIDNLHIRIRAYVLPNHNMFGISCAEAMKRYLMKEVFHTEEQFDRSFVISSHISYDVCKYLPKLFPDKGKNCRNEDDYTYLDPEDSKLYVKASDGIVYEVDSSSKKCVVTIGAVK